LTVEYNKNRHTETGDARGAIIEKAITVLNREQTEQNSVDQNRPNQRLRHARVDRLGTAISATNPIAYRKVTKKMA